MAFLIYDIMEKTVLEKVIEIEKELEYKGFSISLKPIKKCKFEKGLKRIEIEKLIAKAFYLGIEKVLENYFYEGIILVPKEKSTQEELSIKKKVILNDFIESQQNKIKEILK